MSALEPLSLASLVAGVAAIFRFVWLDSLGYPGRDGEVATARTESPGPSTGGRGVGRFDGVRVTAEADRLPRAA
jgi:hypothetical protein